VVKENIRKFLEECKANPDLQQKLKTMKPVDQTALIQIAHEAGFDLPAEEWNEFTNYFRAARQEKLNGEELSDEELANVSAGGLFGIDLCQRRYDELLCDLGAFTCPHFRKKEILKENSGSSLRITYERSCDHAKWSQTYTVTIRNDGLLH